MAVYPRLVQMREYRHPTKSLQSAGRRAAPRLLFLAAFAALVAEAMGQAPSTQACLNYQQAVGNKQTVCQLGCDQFASLGLNGGTALAQCQFQCTNDYINGIHYGCQQGCTILCESGPTAPTTGGPGTPSTTPAAPAGSNATTVTSLVTKPGDVVVTTTLALGHINYYCLGPKVAGLPVSNMNITGSENLYSSGARIGNWTSDFTGKSTYLLKDGVSVTNATANHASYGFKQTSFNGTGCYFSPGDSWEATDGLISNTRITYITSTNSTGGFPPIGATCPPYEYPAQLNGDPSYVWSIPFQTVFTFYSRYAPPPPPTQG